jgi:hypothetical protein
MKAQKEAFMHRVLISTSLLMTVPLIVSAPVIAESAPAKASSGARWLRGFASPDSGDVKGRQNRLNWDPRFHSLLRSSLPQRQFFWRDHGRLTPLPQLVHLFIGVPGDVLLAEGRYLTITGCVPHDCADRGMVWIDTAPAEKTPLIFVATGQVNGGSPSRNSLIHLRLYSSVPLNWQKLPPQFESSLRRWWNSTTHAWDKYAPEQLVMITMVQPTGDTVDLSPSFLLPADGSGSKSLH